MAIERSEEAEAFLGTIDAAAPEAVECLRGLDHS